MRSLDSNWFQAIWVVILMPIVCPLFPQQASSDQMEFALRAKTSPMLLLRHVLRILHTLQ